MSSSSDPTNGKSRRINKIILLVEVIPQKQRVIMTHEKLNIMKKMIGKGTSTKEISNVLNISEASGRKYKRYIEEGSSNILLKPNLKINQNRAEAANEIVRIISENSAITLGGVKKTLEENGLNRSLSSISKLLKVNNYKRKRIQKIPSERNGEQTLDLRQNYCRLIANIPDDRIIFIDETGINLHTSSHFGYAPIGVTPRLVQPANKGVNISALVSISIHGVVSFLIEDGTITGHKFKEFMAALGCPNNVNMIFVMDNAQIHRCRDVASIVQDLNMRVEFLPPYTLQLNPIEEYFSRLKNKIRLRRNSIENRPQLKVLVEEGIHEDSQYSMSGYYRHMRRYIDSGFNREQF